MRSCWAALISTSIRAVCPGGWHSDGGGVSPRRPVGKIGQPCTERWHRGECKWATVTPNLRARRFFMFGWWSGCCSRM